MTVSSLKLQIIFLFQNNDSGALVVSAMLDLLTFSLCPPYSETTEGRHFDSLLEMVARKGRSLFKHFQVSVNFLNTFFLLFHSALILLIFNLLLICKVL